jgi:hypothetical protein
MLIFGKEWKTYTHTTGLKRVQAAGVLGASRETVACREVSNSFVIMSWKLWNVGPGGGRNNFNTT